MKLISLTVIATALCLMSPAASHTNTDLGGITTGSLASPIDPSRPDNKGRYCVVYHKSGLVEDITDPVTCGLKAWMKLRDETIVFIVTTGYVSEVDFRKGWEVDEDFAALVDSTMRLLKPTTVTVQLKEPLIEILPPKPEPKLEDRKPVCRVSCPDGTMTTVHFKETCERLERTLKNCKVRYILN